MAVAKQKAWFGFMFITAQYAPKMTFDQLCFFEPIFMYLCCATHKLCHNFRKFETA